MAIVRFEDSMEQVSREGFQIVASLQGTDPLTADQIMEINRYIDLHAATATFTGVDDFRAQLLHDVPSLNAMEASARLEKLVTVSYQTYERVSELEGAFIARMSTLRVR